jgi:hypothetical protein
MQSIRRLRLVAVPRRFFSTPTPPNLIQPADSSSSSSSSSSKNSSDPASLSLQHEESDSKPFPHLQVMVFLGLAGYMNKLLLGDNNQDDDNKGRGTPEDIAKGWSSAETKSPASLFVDTNTKPQTPLTWTDRAKQWAKISQERKAAELAKIAPPPPPLPGFLLHDDDCYSCYGALLWSHEMKLRGKAPVCYGYQSLGKDKIPKERLAGLDQDPVMEVNNYGDMYVILGERREREQRRVKDKG